VGFKIPFSYKGKVIGYVALSGKGEHARTVGNFYYPDQPGLVVQYHGILPESVINAYRHAEGEIGMGQLRERIFTAAQERGRPTGAQLGRRKRPSASKHESGRNPVVDGTHYPDSTPAELIRVLERLRHTKVRVTIYSGEPSTGKVWGDKESGTIGRSTGTQKIPLLIASRRSWGGPGLLPGSILRVEHAAKPYNVLYLHPKAPKTRREMLGAVYEGWGRPDLVKLMDQYGNLPPGASRSHYDPSAAKHESGGNPRTEYVGHSRLGTRRPLGAPQSMMGTPSSKRKRILGVPLKGHPSLSAKDAMLAARVKSLVGKKK
jgi:hypothetical protein